MSRSGGGRTIRRRRGMIRFWDFKLSGAPPDGAVQEDHERVAVLAALVVAIRLEQAVGQTRLVLGEGELIEQLVHVRRRFRFLGVGQRAEE